MPYKTGIRLHGVARNPANGFPATSSTTTTGLRWRLQLRTIGPELLPDLPHHPVHLWPVIRGIFSPPSCCRLTVRYVVMPPCPAFVFVQPHVTLLASLQGCALGSVGQVVAGLAAVHGDSRLQTNHGLFGALVVEPLETRTETPILHKPSVFLATIVDVIVGS